MFLPAEISLLVLRYLAGIGCKESVRCLFQELPTLKEFTKSNNGYDTQINFEGPEVLGSLSDILYDYGKSKLIVKNLISKLLNDWRILPEESVSPCDTLVTQLRQISTLLGTLSNQSSITTMCLPSLRPRYHDVETQTIKTIIARRTSSTCTTLDSPEALQNVFQSGQSDKATGNTTESNQIFQNSIAVNANVIPPFEPSTRKIEQFHNRNQGKSIAIVKTPPPLPLPPQKRHVRSLVFNTPSPSERRRNPTPSLTIVSEREQRKRKPELIEPKSSSKQSKFPQYQVSKKIISDPSTYSATIDSVVEQSVRRRRSPSIRKSLSRTPERSVHNHNRENRDEKKMSILADKIVKDSAKNRHYIFSKSKEKKLSEREENVTRISSSTRKKSNEVSSKETSGPPLLVSEERNESKRVSNSTSRKSSSDTNGLNFRNRNQDSQKSGNEEQSSKHYWSTPPILEPQITLPAVTQKPKSVPTSSSEQSPESNASTEVICPTMYEPNLISPSFPPGNRTESASPPPLPPQDIPVELPPLPNSPPPPSPIKESTNSSQLLNSINTPVQMLPDSTPTQVEKHKNISTEHSEHILTPGKMDPYGSEDSAPPRVRRRHLNTSSWDAISKTPDKNGIDNDDDVCPISRLWLTPVQPGLPRTPGRWTPSPPREKNRSKSNKTGIGNMKSSVVNKNRFTTNLTSGQVRGPQTLSSSYFIPISSHSNDDSTISPTSHEMTFTTEYLPWNPMEPQREKPCTTLEQEIVDFEVSAQSKKLTLSNQPQTEYFV